MFFSAPDTLIYIQNGSLAVYTNTNASDHSLAIPDSVLSYGEIRDAVALKKLLNDFFSSFSGHKKVIIALSPHFVFEKQIASDSTVTSTQFYQTVPIAQDSLIKKEIIEKDHRVLYATGREICEVIVDVCTTHHWNVVFIVPATVFGLPLNVPFTKEAVQSVLHMHLKKYNFYEDYHKIARKPVTVSSHGEEEIREPSSNTRQYVMLFISLVLVGASIFYALVTFEVIRFSKVSSEIAQPRSGIELNPVQEASGSPAIALSDFNVRIIAQATSSAVLVEDTLSERGFEKIAVESGPRSETESIIVFSDAVPRALRDEVIQVLSDVLLSVSEDTESGTAEDDIFIRVGALQ